MKVPPWFKTIAVSFAGLMVVVLLGAALSVAWRWMRAPEPQGYDQPRVHYNTKNATRFAGSNLAETASLVAQAVYPGTTEANTPDIVIFYDDADWQSGLAASSLVRPLNALILPTSAATTLPDDFTVTGSEQFGGVQALLVGEATIDEERFITQNLVVNVDGSGGWHNVMPATTLSHMGKHAPVLAINADEISPPAAEYLESTKPYPTAPQQQLLNHGWIIGGEGTITWETQTLVDQMLDAYLPFPEE